MSAGKSYNHYSVYNSIQLIKGGSSYFNFLNQFIRNAKETIHIRVYIWNDDTTGTSVADELIEASRRGVTVYAIADGYASQGLSKEFKKRLRSAGIHFRYFEPLLRSSDFYFGRRMHEKIIVVDETKALIGGINFADRYNDVDGIPSWLDYALYVEGEAALELYKYCSKDWTAAKELTAPSPRNFLREPCSVRVRYNDWVKGKNEVWKSYFNFFNQSTESITIMCSYFLPGRILRKRLSMAAKRGVKVKLILAGPSDVRLAKYAERYLYRWMLRNGIEIYEYQPAVLHAKMMVVDNHWVTIGSYNVNNVSAYASMELNVDVRNKPFAASVQQLMDSVIEKDSIKITTRSPVFNPSIIRKFFQKSSYELIRVILNLSTFYFKQE